MAGYGPPYQMSIVEGVSIDDEVCMAYALKVVMYIEVQTAGKSKPFLLRRTQNPPASKG